MNKTSLLVLPILIFASVLVLVYPAISTTVSSPGSNFTIFNSTVYLNWTNSYVFGVVINSTANNDSVNIFNASSALAANYSQSNSQSICTQYFLLVQNASAGKWTNTTILLNATNMTTMNLVDNAVGVGGPDHSTCLPGRYSTTTFNFANSSNSNENANIAVISDIPISTNNTLSASTHIGSFSGTLPGNATNGTYQSYFFNTNATPNATAITLNLSTSAGQIANLWLMNGTVVLAKSINQNTSQFLSYNFLPPTTQGQWWEARVFGNSTSAIAYNGFITYSTLNVSNASNTVQQVSTINFGTMNVSSNNTLNLNLNNAGNISLSNVALSSNIYRTIRFGGNAANNYSFLVSDSSIASKIHVSLNWTGATSYTLNLYDPSGNLVTTSSNYYMNANASSVNQELFNETSSIAQGFWTASVVDNNAGTDPYNVTIFVYQGSSWISSNYTTTSFNQFTTNATYVNLTVPNTTIDGNYEGQIIFTDANNAAVVIPFNVTVTTPTLILQNASFSPTVLNTFISDSYRIDENTNTSLNKTLYLNLTNLGSFDSIVTISNSSNLTCTSCGAAYYANLTVNTTSINASSHASQIISFNIIFNYSIPTGSYTGWIFFNSTNSTNVLSAHPYSTYNLTLNLNLTNLLTVKITNIQSFNGDRIARNTAGENVTAIMNLTYVNATPIGLGTQILVSNFTSLWLQEGNVSSLGRTPSSGSLSLFNGTNPLFLNSFYNVNFTVPSSQPGGLYTLHTQASVTRTDGLVLSGEGISSSPLVVNNTGLFMSTNTSGVCSFGSTCSNSIAINPNATLTVYANIANYGPVTASGATLNITTACTAYTIAAGSTYGNCTQSSFSGTAWSGVVFPYSNNCTVTWTLTAGTSAATSCATAYLMGGGSTWFDPSGINLTITVSNTTSSSSNSNSNNNNNLPTSTSTAVYVSITNYPSIIYVIQNSTNSTTVTVKNVNDSKTQDIGLSMTNLTSSWYSITPAVQTSIPPYSSTNFSLAFTVSGGAAVQDYNANLVASSTYGNDTKGFIVRVLPSANTKVLINDTYQLYNLNYTNLAADVNKSKASGMNTTLVEADLSAVKMKLDQAQSYINSGDYFSAQQALNQAKALLDQAHNDFQNLTKNPFSDIFGSLAGNWWIYAGITGGAVVVVVVAYLFWPAKEDARSILFKPKIGQKSPEDNSVWQKLKNKWKKTS